MVGRTCKIIVVNAHHALTAISVRSRIINIEVVIIPTT